MIESVGYYMARFTYPNSTTETLTTFELLKNEGGSRIEETGSITCRGLNGTEPPRSIVNLMEEYLLLQHDVPLRTEDEVADLEEEFLRDGASSIGLSYECSAFGELSLKMDILNARTIAMQDVMMRALADINENVLENWHPAD